MLYAILCYDSEDVVGSWTKEKDAAVMAELGAVQQKLAKQGRLGPVARLLPTTAATTVRKGREPLIIDGPFAETKEQLLGFYVVDCATLEEAIEVAKDLGARQRIGGRLRAPPGRALQAGRRRRVTEIAWIDAALTAARPQAIGALLRYFRDLDTAEEAFQDACLRALRSWPQNGPPRNPAAWLILVGRNAAIDAVRRRGRQQALPEEATISDLDDAEDALAERLDGAHYRDDILRLLFICCHPELPATQQIALALRIVSGLSVKQIARAFLVSEAAMEQRITRAKSRIAAADVPFETPGRGGARGAARRGRRDDLPRLQRGLLGRHRAATAPARRSARRRSGWRGCCCGCSRPSPEIMGLTALMLLQHSRTPARFDENGAIVLLEDQDRGLWDRKMIAEGLALVDKAIRHRRPGPYQVQAAIAALHARAARPEATDWAEIDLLYATLERLQPSPVVTLNRAVAVAKVRGAAAALALVEPLEAQLSGYFHFFGVKGALLMQLGRAEEARIAFDRAIALANTAAEAAHIRMHLDRLAKDSAPAEISGAAR